jgi:hypothetical protein
MSKNTKPQPDWENVLSVATRLQHILPGATLATLVGGTASAIYANHRVSCDADHIMVDLRGHYKEYSHNSNPSRAGNRAHQGTSLRTCVLLDKRGRREADFVGFQIPDRFVVGYGLDFTERYRNLPCIGILKPELQNPPEWA